MEYKEMFGMQVRVTGNTYQHAKRLRSCGFTFDGATKSWIGKLFSDSKLNHDDLVILPLAPVAVPANVDFENEGQAPDSTIDRTPYSPGE